VSTSTATTSAIPFVGVATPQANPTVEIELRRLLEHRAVPLATRLTSAEPDPDARLVEYLEQIDRAIRSFDTLPLGAFAFACTASSYLVGHARELALLDEAQRAYRVPIVTATLAIAEELRLRNARRIAILAPYPQPLVDASIEYWQELGFQITRHERIDVGDDTRAIYALTDTQVLEAVSRFDAGGADVTLLSGTGMPTMAALINGSVHTVSSNLCLAGAVLRRVDYWRADKPVDVNILLGG